MNKPYVIQDVLLNQLCKKRIPATFHLINGYQLRGQISAFDNFVVVLIGEENKQMMIYKHAISTITPNKPVPLGVPEGEGN